MKLRGDEFFDYRNQDYSENLYDVDYLLDTVGDKELEKEFKLLKNGGKLISLKGMPNSEFADRVGLGFFKKMILKWVGRGNDKMADKINQNIIFYLSNEWKVISASFKNF